MKKSILILVAGGTASGKTTVVDEITSHFNSDDISVICMDNYYKKRDDISLEERKNINYDHPNSYDLELLINDLILERNSGGFTCSSELSRLASKSARFLCCSAHSKA